MYLSLINYLIDRKFDYPLYKTLEKDYGKDMAKFKAPRNNTKLWLKGTRIIKIALYLTYYFYDFT